MAEELLALQRELFVVGADLATNPTERAKLQPGVSLVTSDMTERLERRIDELVAERALPEAFIVPGANEGSAALDLARDAVRPSRRPASTSPRTSSISPEAHICSARRPILA